MFLLRSAVSKLKQRTVVLITTIVILQSIEKIKRENYGPLLHSL